MKFQVISGDRVPLPPVRTAPPVVRLHGFDRRFGDTKVIEQLDLEIGDGEFVALLGRSGSARPPRSR